MPVPLRARHRQPPASRGVHHLALNTEDMKLTIDFYTRVLGMPLVHALRVPPGVGTGAGNRGNPPFENLRHYFFDAGGEIYQACVACHNRYVAGNMPGPRATLPALPNRTPPPPNQ